MTLACLAILARTSSFSHEIRIIKRETNHDWQPDAGHFRILQVKDPSALVIQGGQRAGSTFESGRKYSLLNINTGSMTVVDLEHDLKARGRAEGYIYMIRNDGTLLLICPSLEDKDRNPQWQRSVGIIPELWVRYPGGEYYRAGASRHYTGIRGDDIIYWIPDTRRYMAFDLITRNTTWLQDYKRPPFQDVTRGIAIDDDGRHLLLGQKRDADWHYVSIGLEPEQLME